MSLENKIKIFSEIEMQILSYFLDGTRRVYKVDEIAYQTGSRKLIYPVVAAQVVTGCCRRLKKILHPEKINDRFKLKISKIISYSTDHNPAKKFEERAVAKVMENMHDTEINLVADLPKFCRTPVTICERGDFHGGQKIAVWYLRLRDKKFSDSPFDGVIKVEKILVTDSEISSGKIVRDEVNLLSAYLLNERNPVCYGTDPRRANHLYSIF